MSFRGASTGAAAGSSEERVVHFLNTGPTTWTERSSISATNGADPFGFSLSMSGDGSALAVGAPSEGSAGSGFSTGVTSNAGAAGSGAVFLY